MRSINAIYDLTLLQVQIVILIYFLLIAQQINEIYDLIRIERACINSIGQDLDILLRCCFLGSPL